MKKGILLVSICISALAIFANGISLNSIGPKAAAMGGAFIGQADDATAVYWNPAGLTGQKATIDFSLVDVYEYPTYKREDIGIDAEGSDEHYLSPHLFMNYAKDKFAWGFGIYVPHGLGADWEGDQFTAFSGPAELAPGLSNPFAGKTYEWKSKIAMISVSSSAAYQVSDRFSVGITVNINHGSMEIKRGEDRVSLTASPGSIVAGTDGMLDTQYEEEVEGSGTSFGLGIQYDLMDNLKLGVSYHSPSVVALKGDASLDLPSGKEELYVRRDLEIPMWVGMGLSYQPSDRWVVNFDVQMTNWNTFDKMVTQVVMEEGTENILTHMDWEECVQFRIGTEYKASKCLALRAGYFYDPAPAPDETLNILFPSSENHNAAIGLGYTMGNVTLDLAAEYYFGQERETDVPAAGEEVHYMQGTHQMDLFAYIVGLKYTF